ncbi:hypothetical protein MPH_13571, partial [Macrophomina phaseolina MS6]
ETLPVGFQGAGLIPFDPEAVTSKLDVKLRTPTPIGTLNANADLWVSRTPHNPTEAISQSELVTSRINGHQGSSPTPIFFRCQANGKGFGGNGPYGNPFDRGEPRASKGK